MDLRDVILRVHEARGSEDALRLTVERLRPSHGIWAAARVTSGGTDPDAHFGAEWLGGSDLAAEIGLARSMEVRRLDPSLVPDPASADASDLLLLPLGHGGAVVALFGPRDAFAAKGDSWAALGRAFGSIAARELLERRIQEQAARVHELEAERDELIRRGEEGEVLHTLGLAANRSLDPEEVLGLIGRVTRTALGASYVTVSTDEPGGARMLDSVGLEGEPPDQDSLADLVVGGGRPVRVGPGEEAGAQDFPLHEQEGMRVGLGVPLSLYGSTFGALVIGYRREVDLTARTVRLALTLSGHAAVAISNARLHQALANRSADVERAYRQLRWSAETKERFFASLSHEIRTPLNAILGYNSLVLEGIAGEAPPRIRSFVENAQRAAQGLLHLVSDVLDLSKIEAGKIELNVQPTLPSELVHDAMATVRPLADQKRLPLVFEAPPDLPPIDTDPDRVRQILLNLLSNAVKFTDAGEVVITLRDETDRAATGGDERRLAIRVTDSGPGIDGDDQERIFQEFEQITGKTAGGGTGLGLPISRKLARFMGGDIRVESSRGAGSTFVLLLPWAPPPPAGTSVATRMDP